jgi:hypothetical protein
MEPFDTVTSAPICCAFCRKPLSIDKGRAAPWRASTGDLFCNEFCADDAEEARFQKRGRLDRRAAFEMGRV